MLANDNKSLIRMFIEEVINQGRLERADDIVIEDFVKLDPLPGQAQGREGLKEVIRQGEARFRISVGQWMKCWRRMTRCSPASPGPVPTRARFSVFPPPGGGLQ